MRNYEMTLSQEEKLNKVIVSLHPHKQDPSLMRVKSFIVRKGWGTIMKMIKEADNHG